LFLVYRGLWKVSSMAGKHWCLFFIKGLAYIQPGVTAHRRYMSGGRCLKNTFTLMDQAEEAHGRSCM
jgi:hypothetical protein